MGQSSPWSKSASMNHWSYKSLQGICGKHISLDKKQADNPTMLHSGLCVPVRMSFAVLNTLLGAGLGRVVQRIRHMEVQWWTQNKACPHNAVSSIAHVKKLLQLSSFDGKGKQRLSSVAFSICVAGLPGKCSDLFLVQHVCVTLGQIRNGMCVIYLFSSLQTPSTLCWLLSAECLLFKGWLLSRANPSPEEVDGNLSLDLRMLWIETQSSSLHAPIELCRVSECARKEPLALQLLSVNINQQSKYKQWAFPHLVIK